MEKKDKLEIIWSLNKPFYMYVESFYSNNYLTKDGTLVNFWCKKGDYFMGKFLNLVPSQKLISPNSTYYDFFQNSFSNISNYDLGFYMSTKEVKIYNFMMNKCFYKPYRNSFSLDKINNFIYYPPEITVYPSFYINPTPESYSMLRNYIIFSSDLQTIFYTNNSGLVTSVIDLMLPQA